MRWLDALHKKFDKDVESPPNKKVDEETRQILENAKSALGEARQRREDVSRVTQALEEIRRKNHFGESFELALTRRN